MKENVEVISLSFSFIVLSLFSIPRIVSAIEYPKYSRVFFGFNSSLFIPMYSAMILLTLQRFFAIWLHLRYESSWVCHKRTHMVVVSWVISGIFLVTTVTGYWLKLMSFEVWVYLTISISGFGLFLTNASFLVVYSYIYIKYRKSNQTTRNVMYKNRKTKIFTPFVICLSFFIFGTLPHLLRSLVDSYLYSLLWFYLDGLSNSIVYIFMNGSVRRCFRQWQNGGRVQRRHRSDFNTSSTSNTHSSSL